MAIITVIDYQYYYYNILIYNNNTSHNITIDFMLLFNGDRVPSHVTHRTTSLATVLKPSDHKNNNYSLRLCFRKTTSLFCRDFVHGSTVSTRRTICFIFYTVCCSYNKYKAYKSQCIERRYPVCLFATLRTAVPFAAVVFTPSNGHDTIRLIIAIIPTVAPNYFRRVGDSSDIMDTRTKKKNHTFTS